MKKSLLVLVTILMLTTSSFAQVAINTDGATPDASAILDISSTDKGLLIPRMTTDNRINNITPVTSLMVYDTDTESFWYYDGTQSSWIEIKAGSALDINSLADAIADGQSIFIGDQVGTNDDGSNYNTVLGDEAFKVNTSGQNNTAFGYKTLEGSYGGGNSAFGANALRENTLGDYNTGIGKDVLYYNHHGSNNTAIGYEAGKGQLANYNISGCVYIGYQAGQDNEISDRLYISNSDDPTPLIGGNFAIDQVDINGTIKITGGGAASGRVLTSDADGNATWETKTYGATDLNGLSDAKTSETNIFLGDSAGYSSAQAVAFRNTAIGIRALKYNFFGDNNTAIGYEAGKGLPGNDISGNVFLGYQAGMNNTDNNKLFIDNSSTTTPLIGGDFSSDELYFNATKVGIGTDDPNEMLEIAGSTSSGARMIISDGGGSSRKVLLLVSPDATHDYARIDAYDYGVSGLTLKINTAGSGGNVIIGGNVLPESDKGMDLGASGTAWNNVYAVNFANVAAAAFANINVTEQLLSFPPQEKKAGASGEFTDKGLKVLNPASLPKELTEDNALLIDEMTTYNYKANYEQQQQIETLKTENAKLKARLEKLEKLISQK